MTATRVANLLRKLEQVFGELPSPAQADIVPKTSPGNPEYEQLRSRFKDRHWRDLSAEDLRGEADSLTLFSPEGFRFFLPAFIRAVLLGYGTADLIPDVIVWKFIPTVDPALSSYYEDRIRLLTRAQRQAVTDFISFLQDAHPEDFPAGELERAYDSLSS